MFTILKIHLKSLFMEMDCRYGIWILNKLILELSEIYLFSEKLVSNIYFVLEPTMSS